MNMQHRTNVDATIRGEAWMQLEDPNMTIAEAIAELESLGNDIVEVDEDNRRIKVLDEEMCIEEVVYVCDNCPAYSRSEAKAKEHEARCI